MQILNKMTGVRAKMWGTLMFMAALLVGTAMAGRWALEKARESASELAGQAERERYEAVLREVVETQAFVLGERVREVDSSEDKEELVRAVLADVRFFDNSSGYFFAFHVGGTVLTVPTDLELTGQNMIHREDSNGVPFIAELERVAQRGGGQVSYLWPKPGSEEPQEKISWAVMIPGMDVWIGTGTYLDDVEAAQAETATALIAATATQARLLWVLPVLMLVLAVVAAIWLDRTANVVGPVRQVSSNLNELAYAVTQAADELKESSVLLSDSATASAANLQEVAASVEEIESMAQHNAEDSGAAANHAHEAASETDKGKLAIDRLSTVMEEINHTSDETVGIIKVISEIAFQTNILALNAAVEAARAGESGRGFAVVAEEVRALAMRSSEAADKTSEFATLAQQRTANGLKVSGEISEVFGVLSTNVGGLTELTEKVSSASQQQSQAIEQINGSLAQLSASTQETAGKAERNASISNELGERGEVLVSDVAALGRIVGQRAEPGAAAALPEPS